ncbi:hypothetical protein FRB97_003473 [Tulasnella sp. 331]|nr:hypothetical protein FRB97_003473 [Tulasnella sp. 331]
MSILEHLYTSKITPMSSALAKTYFGFSHIGICYLAFRDDFIDQGDESNRFSKPITVLTLCIFIIGLLINLYTTALIAGRLWWTSRQVQRRVTGLGEPPNRLYTNIIYAVIESGALYTVACLATLICGSITRNAFATFEYIDAMLAGIIPTLLLLHLNKNKLLERQSEGAAPVNTTIRFSPMVLLAMNGTGPPNAEDARDSKYNGGEDPEHQAYELDSIKSGHSEQEDSQDRGNAEL